MRTKQALETVVVVGLLAVAGGCSHKVVDYCDDSTPCTNPERPFCDVNGQYESSGFIGNTCIPDPFPDGGTSVDAGADGDGGSNLCGNTKTDQGEDCDDGNKIAGDGCENDCSYTPGVHYVVAGLSHTCALFWSGQVKCWGDASSGQLGLGSTENIGDDEAPSSAPFVDLGGRVVQVSASLYHTCAVLDTGKLKCWGNNSHGQLGYGDLETRGDEPGEMPPPDVPLPAPVTYVAAMWDRTCAIMIGGRVRCWGAGDQGGALLGYGVAGDFSDAGALPSDVSIGGAAVQLAGGQLMTCVVLETGDVRCWGVASEFGTLGYGNTLTIGDDELPSDAGPVALPAKAVSVSCGALHTCARLDNDALYCWGTGGNGGLGYGNRDNIGDDETPQSAGAVSTGGATLAMTTGMFHSCAVVADGVRCWGPGNDGRLGTGATATVGDDELPSSLPTVSVGATVRTIAAGERHTCVTTTTSAVRCWGGNMSGQLGYGNTTSIGDDELPSTVGNVPLF